MCGPVFNIIYIYIYAIPSFILYLIIMKADQNGPFFQPEEWKSMLRKGMPPKLQAVGKAPPKNPGPKPRGSFATKPKAKVQKP